MGIWIFMLIMNLMVPVLMIGLGRWMWKATPGKINYWIGYRTSRSMKNQDTWEFAHDYCGRLWWKIGWIMFPVSIVLMFPLIGKSTDTISILGSIIELVQCIVLVGSIFPVEKALKNTFDQDGKRRDVL